MITLNLEIDGEARTFDLPESWNEVSVDTFSKIWGIDREAFTPIELTVESVSLMTGIDSDSLMMMTPVEFNKVAEIIEFTNKDVEGTNVDSITVDGEEYFLYKDFNKLTMGEVISLEILMEKADGKLMTVMPDMLCLFLRKKKENGKLESFKKSFMERAESFKKVSIADVNDIFLFFSNGGDSSISNMKESLENQSQ
jgi:hypothetical protein